MMGEPDVSLLNRWGPKRAIKTLCREYQVNVSYNFLQTSTGIKKYFFPLLAVCFCAGGGFLYFITDLINNFTYNVLPHIVNSYLFISKYGGLEGSTHCTLGKHKYLNWLPNP